MKGGEVMTGMNLIELHKVLLSGERFIIAGHENPDGDAVSAAFALARAVQMIGGKPAVLLGGFSERYKNMPGSEFLYEGNPEDLTGDVFIAVDCATKARLGGALAVFGKIETTVNIDHHATNERYAKHNFINPEASSTCELLYLLINHMVPMDVEIASNLYTGIVFDTGGFCYGSATFETFQTASRLIRMGVDFTRINKLVLHSHTLAEAKAFGRALSNMRLESAGRIAVSLLASDELEEIGADYSDLDGIVEYMLTTGSAVVSMLVTERPGGRAKVSVRSAELDLTPIVTRHGGGGHKNAAGYTAEGAADEVLARAVSELAAALIEID
jgi:phosphoesterase RecJ-like protein